MADFSIAQLAQARGDLATYQTFMHRAQFWRNTFDTQIGYIEPRLKDGSFIPVDPAMHTDFVEGNPAQYSWMIPYNLRAVFDLMGGNAKVVQRLDNFFTELNAGEDAPYFWVGNEPVFSVPWAYDYVGAPWRTQAVVRQVETELVYAQPGRRTRQRRLGGHVRVVCVRGIGCVSGHSRGGRIRAGQPTFPQRDDSSRKWQNLEIDGENASPTNPYIQSLRVNGKPFQHTWVSYDTLEPGRDLAVQTRRRAQQRVGNQVRRMHHHPFGEVGRQSVVGCRLSAVSGQWSVATDNGQLTGQ